MVWCQLILFLYSQGKLNTKSHLSTVVVIFMKLRFKLKVFYAVLSGRGSSGYLPDVQK